MDGMYVFHDGGHAGGSFYMWSVWYGRRTCLATPLVVPEG